jgi:hypothetical protein
MKKLRLDPDALAVESFATHASGAATGTVRGRDADVIVGTVEISIPVPPLPPITVTLQTDHIVCGSCDMTCGTCLTQCASCFTCLTCNTGCTSCLDSGCPTAAGACCLAHEDIR